MQKVFSTPGRQSNVVYVFDTSVDKFETLVSGINRTANIILIDGSCDGLRQLAIHLSGQADIEELHIVSHGRDGTLVLGNTVLSKETLGTYASELMILNRALSSSADILLYGCEIAKTEKGEAFVADLAEATGANIAASQTLTGSADLGGDWDLDVHVGALTAGIGFSDTARARYKEVLAPTTLTFSSNGGGSIGSDNTASDGEGGSTDISGIEIQIINISDTNGTQISSLNWYSDGDLSAGDGFTGVTTDFGFGGQWKGMAIKSADGSEFQLESFDFFDWGTFPYSSSTMDIVGYRDNVQVATGSFSSNGNNNRVSVDIASNTSFDSVDEVRITFNSGTGYLSLNNIVIDDNVPANSAPALGGTPADDTATEDVATAIDLSAYNVSDADGDTITLTLAVDRGTVASTDGNGTTAGVTVANSGTGSMTLQGTAANLNTYLNDTSKITYTTASNDTTTAVLTVTPNDGTVNGTADTVNITISAVNDAPVLDAAQSPVLTAIDEDAGDDDGSGADGDDDGANNANNPGTTVAMMVVDGSITDADGGAVEAIAITTVDNTNGVWQYSTDNGTSWNAFSGTTGSSVDITSTARLLDGSLSGASTQLVRFVPEAGYNGTATLTFYAWDKSSGTAGGTADASTTGNATAFSTASDTASVTVNAVNDAPVFTGLDGTPAFTEGGSAVVLDANVTVADVELDALNGGNGDYSGASLTIARNGGADASDVFAVPTGGNLTVAGGPNGGGTITAGGNAIATIANTGNGQIQLSFADNGTTPTTALVNEVLQAITYENTGNDLTSDPQLDWSFSDGATNGTGSITVTLTDVNDAPTLTATGGNPTFTEGGGAQDLYNTVSADTVETGQTFTALTLTVTNVADGASEILSFDGSDVALTHNNTVTPTATNGLTVGVSVTGSTATLSFSGATLSEAQLQTLVDGLTYRNESQDPTTAGNRVVTITSVTDSGGGTNSATPNLTSTVSLTAVNDPPVIGNLNGDNTGLQPGATATIDTDGNATVANPDAADYNGGFLTITQTGGAASGDFSVDGTAVTSGGDATVSTGEAVQVGGIDIGTVNVLDDGQGGNDLTINFGANATSARIETLIQNLSWSAAAGSGAQTFTLTLNDADGIANGGDADTTANFTMTLGNAPVLDLDGNDSAGTGSGGYATAFTESTPVAIADTDVVLTDSDGGATISAITISLTNDQNGADEGLSVSAAAQNALTGIAGAADITRQDTISITGVTASLAEVQTFLQTVFYDNVSDAPDLTARTITVTVTDNDGLTSSSVTSTISVANVNDVPVFAGVDNAAAFTEDGAAVVLDANATVADAELDALNSGNGNYNGATLTLARNGGANAEDTFANNGLLAALTEGGNLTYNGTTVGTVTTNSSGTLVLTFNASATSALVDSVLQNITYSNSNDTPPANVQINYTFNDGNSGTQGSGGAGSDADDSITVTITAANDAPVFTNLDGDAPSGAPSAVIAFDTGGNVTVTDADSTDFNTGILTITRTGALEGNFALNDANATSGGDGTIAAGQTIAVGATSIGTVTTDGQGANNLVITLNANATPANVQALIQALTYSSAETGSHGFSVTLTDGDGGTSSAATVTLSVANPSTGGGGGGSTGPVTVVTEDNDDGSGPPTTTTTVTTGSGGSGSAAIVQNTNNNGNVVTATLPANTSISSTGPKTAQTPSDAVTTLVNAVDARNSNSESDLIIGAQTFLNQLASTTTLDVRTIIPTTTQTSLSDPIVITGTSTSGGSSQSEAFVIDMRTLPTGSTLQLDNIEFASIIGSTRVTGGAGSNYVVGDDNSQFIVLGEGDDQLFGGAGDDTVGSTTGNDQIFGDAGDDLLFGGAGNDTLSGGANRDAALYGATRDGVTLSGTRGTVTAVDAGGTDTLTGVELVVFTGENTTGKDRVTVLLQDNAPAAGQYGFNEAAYLNAHPDVAAAVAAGIFASGAEHYALYGDGEGRIVDLVFDAQFYLADNPDVAAAVTEGIFASASEHYQLHGYAENRSLNPLFDGEYYLTQNEDVANAVTSGAFESAYHHFVLYGDQEGRAASRFFDTAAYRTEQGLSNDVSALEHFLLIGLPQGMTAPTAADFTSEGLA
ncbi:DUF4347 domain-containing protein [Roseibium sp. MB-4]